MIITACGANIVVSPQVVNMLVILAAEGDRSRQLSSLGGHGAVASGGRLLEKVSHIEI
ncbi:MAG: hypothetical protein ABL931_05120 [Usitatibacteraceae bacterium]